MYLFCLFLSLIFFCICTEVYTFKDLKTDVTCYKSDSYDWYVRSTKKCPEEDLYHCLHDVNDRNRFYEFCGDFITVPPGTYPVFRPDPPAILSRDCIGDTFQNQYLKSSILNNCFDRKKCDDKGQLVCENGSKTEDRRCKCDIRIGMVIKIYGDSPSNEMTCCPDSDLSCDCFPKKCDPGFVLNEVYQCVEKCENSGCVSSTRSVDDVTKETTKPVTELVLSTFVLPSTPTVVATENKPKSTEKLSLETILFIVLFSSLVLLSGACIATYVCCPRPYNGFTTGSCNNNLDDSPEKEQMLFGTRESINDSKGPSGNNEIEMKVNVQGDLNIYNVNSENAAIGTEATVINTDSKRNNGGDDIDDEDENDDQEATDLKEVITGETKDCDSSDFKGFR